MGSFLVEESTLPRLPNKVDIQVLKEAGNSNSEQ